MNSCVYISNPVILSQGWNYPLPLGQLAMFGGRHWWSYMREAATTIWWIENRDTPNIPQQQDKPGNSSSTKSRDCCWTNVILLNSESFLLVTRIIQLAIHLWLPSLLAPSLMTLRSGAKGIWMKVLLIMRKTPCESTEELEEINYHWQKSNLKMCLLVGLIEFPSYWKNHCLENA